MGSNELIGPQRNGTIHGTGMVVPAIRGNGITFNGVNQYVDMGQYPGECLTNLGLCMNGFTWMMWLKLPSGAPASEVLLLSAGYGYGTGTYGISLRHSPDNIYAFQWHVAGKMHRFPTNFARNQWFQFAFVCNSPDSCMAYIDGENVAGSVGSFNTNPAVGSGQTDLGRSITGDRYAEFSIDEIVFWEETKDAQFIQSIYDIQRN